MGHNHARRGAPVLEDEPCEVDFSPARASGRRVVEEIRMLGLHLRPGDDSSRGEDCEDWQRINKPGAFTSISSQT